MTGLRARPLTSPNRKQVPARVSETPLPCDCCGPLPVHGCSTGPRALQRPGFHMHIVFPPASSGLTEPCGFGAATHATCDPMFTQLRGAPAPAQTPSVLAHPRPGWPRWTAAPPSPEGSERASGSRGESSPLRPGSAWLFRPRDGSRFRVEMPVVHHQLVTAWPSPRERWGR